MPGLAQRASMAAATTSVGAPGRPSGAPGGHRVTARIAKHRALTAQSRPVISGRRPLPRRSNSMVRVERMNSMSVTPTPPTKRRYHAVSGGALRVGGGAVEVSEPTGGDDHRRGVDHAEAVGVAHQHTGDRRAVVQHLQSHVAAPDVQGGGRVVQRPLHLRAGGVTAGMHDAPPGGCPAGQRPLARRGLVAQRRHRRSGRPPPGKPSATIDRTVSGSHSPAPAARVSATCDSTGVVGERQHHRDPTPAWKVAVLSALLKRRCASRCRCAAGRRPARRRRSRRRRRQRAAASPGPGTGAPHAAVFIPRSLAPARRPAHSPPPRLADLDHPLHASPVPGQRCRGRRRPHRPLDQAAQQRGGGDHLHVGAAGRRSLTAWKSIPGAALCNWCSMPTSVATSTCLAVRPGGVQHAAGGQDLDPVGGKAPSPARYSAEVAQPHSGWTYQLGIGMAVGLGGQFVAVDAGVDVARRRPRCRCSPATRHPPDMGAQELVGQNSTSRSAGIEATTSTALEDVQQMSVSLDRRGGVDVGHHDGPGVLVLPRLQFLGVDGVRQRATGPLIGNQDGLVRTEDLGRSRP